MGTSVTGYNQSEFPPTHSSYVGIIEQWHSAIFWSSCNDIYIIHSSSKSFFPASFDESQIVELYYVQQMSQALKSSSYKDFQSICTLHWKF